MNIDVEIIDAVRGEQVPEKVIPAKDYSRFMQAEIGCWRSHMNIMQEFVSQRSEATTVPFNKQG